MNNQMSMAADIRFGVHHRLTAICAHIDKCVTDYALGGLYPQDDDYYHMMRELANVRDQVREFIEAKERLIRAQPFTKEEKDGS